MSDLDFMQSGEATSSELDPSYTEMLKRAEEVGEGEERVGRDPLPRSDFHIGRVTGIEFRQIPFEVPVDAIRITLQADEGSVDGAVKRFYSDDLRISVGTKTADKAAGKGADGRFPERDRTPAEQRAVEDAFIQQMQRVKRVLGTGSLFPPSKDKAGAEAWGRAALDYAKLGRKVIFTGYSDDKGFGHIVFSSLRAPEDPAKDYRKKGHPVIEGKNALEQALEENAKANERAAKS